MSSVSHIATTVTLWQVGCVVSTFLPHELCQSCIDGQSGSSACTVIATLVARDILHQDLVTGDGHSVVLKQALLQQFVKCIRAGNCLYDERGQAFGLLGLYDVLHLFAEIGLKATPHFDLTIRNRSTATSVIDKVLYQARSKGKVVAGVCVLHPTSICLMFTPDGRMVVFDSHAHGSAGALVAVAGAGVSAVVLAEYLAERHGPLKDTHCMYMLAVQR